MTSYTFVLTRKGTFTINAFTSNQCKAKGHTSFLYKIKITCDSKLDDHGFVIDHQIIDNVVQNTTHVGSCEQICEVLHKRLLAVLELRKIECQNMVIKIKPDIKSPISNIKYIWKK